MRSGEAINGTYIGAMGMLQRGELDMILSEMTVTTARAAVFAFTVPISFEKIVVLLRRPHFVFVRFDNLNANIDVGVYVLAFIAILSLIIIFVLQDRLVNFTDHVDTWKIVHLSMPGSCTQALTNERGWTKKVIIISINFTLLMLTSYYQCQQLSALLVPQQLRIPKNIDHLETDMLDGNIKTAFTTVNRSIEVELYTGTFRLARMMQKIWHKHPPNYITDFRSNAEAIRNNKTMVIGLMSNVYSILRYIPPKTCDEYELITLEELPAQMMGLMFRPKYERIHRINNVIEVRRHWYRRLIDENQVDALCREKLFPSYNQELLKKPLDILTLSGVIVAYTCAVFISLLGLFIEILWKRFVKPVCKQHYYIDDYVGENVYKEYMILLNMIAHAKIE